ncbi:MAG: Crp/Fnr family transcriptional regulator [Burkholderiales bacterium]
MPRLEKKRLLAICEPVLLVQGEVLFEPGQATHHVYFPTEGYISLIAPIDGTPALEVGMVGSEGMVGAQLALGVPTVPLHALVQGSGISWRIPAKAFNKELQDSPALQRLMNRYVYVLMGEMAVSAACLRYHQIGPRLARWLLMSHDRAHADQFQMTQEFLAYMLGVRRVGITAAAGALQRDGLIEYHRGQLTVRNRAGLEDAACDCYDTNRQSYNELL